MWWFLASLQTAHAGSGQVDDSADLQGDGAVAVEITCGSLHVTAVHGPHVHLTGTMAGGVGMEGSPGRVEIDATSRDGAGCVALDLEMPARAGLEVEGQAVDLTVDGLEGSIRVGTLSGFVVLHGAPSSVDVQSVSGAVTLDGASGRVNVSSVSGALAVSGVQGEVSAETVSGDIGLRSDTALPSVAIDSVSGNVDLAIRLLPAGQLEANSHSGAIAVHLPADTDAAFELSTFSGTVKSELGGGKNEFTLGAGRGRVEIATFSGGIALAPLGPPAPSSPAPPAQSPGDPGSFEQIVRQAISECAPSAVLQGVDCTGSPCVARFTDPSTPWAAIVGCAPWNAAYGSTASTLGGTAQCTDGTLVPYFLMAPDVGGTPGMARVSKVRSAFPCGAGNSEPASRHRGR
jgi:hypothetical protein